MPIVLTTAASPGDNDPGQTYPKGKVTNINIDILQSFVQVTMQFGDDPGSVWGRGPGLRMRRFTIQDNPSADPATTDFTDLLATLTNDGENIHDAIKRIVYAKLQADNPELDGTVE